MFKSHLKEMLTLVSYNVMNKITSSGRSLGWKKKSFKNSNTLSFICDKFIYFVFTFVSKSFSMEKLH